MKIDEIVQAIGGPTDVPVQPEGGSDVTPLTGHHQARYGAEPFPTNVDALQGAGTPSSGGLTPNPQEPTDGNVLRGHKGGSYTLGATSVDVATEQVARLTAANRNRPEGGLDGQIAAPADDAGVRQSARDSDQGRGLNPALGTTPKRFRGV